MSALLHEREAKPCFADLAERLLDERRAIEEELRMIRGTPVHIGGYFKPDPLLASRVMTPSRTFDATLRGSEEARSTS